MPVVSPTGDVYPSVITCVRDPRVKRHHRPDRHGGGDPDAAHGVAARWMMDTFGSAIG